MTLAYLRDYCLSKSGVTEDTPFDANTLCFRVGGKIFAITDLVDFEYINLKCEPEYALELREQYDGVRPGYHMNKKMWNSVYVSEDVPDPLILDLVDRSYRLIFASLPKKLQAEINP